MKILLTLCILLLQIGTAAAAAKPNVLLVMADDLRDFGGAFTREVVKTPNIDRLRARGTTFERAYVQYPVCNPSRSSMMTGLRAEQTGIVGSMGSAFSTITGNEIHDIYVQRLFAGAEMGGIKLHGAIDVLTAPEAFADVKAAMDAAGLKADIAEVTYRADNDSPVAGETAQQVDKLLRWLEDLDDVQSVAHNAELGADAYA